MKLKKLTFFFIYTCFAATLIILMLVTYVIWEEDTIRKHSNAFLLQYASPYLPENYQLQSLDLHWSLRGIIRGEGLRLKSSLITPYGHLQLQGPIKIERKSLLNLILKRHEDVRLQVLPEFLFGSSPSDIHSFAKGTVQIMITDNSHEIQKINFQMDMNHIPRFPFLTKNFSLSGDINFQSNEVDTQIKLMADSLNLKFANYDIGIGDIKANVEYKDCHISYHLNGKSIEFESSNLRIRGRPEIKAKTFSVCDSKKSKSVVDLDLFSTSVEMPKRNLTLALAQIHSSVRLSPLIPNQIVAQASARQLEVLWKEEYIDPPIENYTLLFDILNEPDQESLIKLKKINLQVLQTLSNQKKRDIKKTIFDLHVQGEDLFVPEIEKNIILQSNVTVSDIKSFLPPVTLAGWNIRGNILAQAHIDYSLQGTNIRKGTSLLLDNFQFQHDELRHLSHDISIKWEAQNNRMHSMDIFFPSIRQFNIVASLGPWHLPITYDDNRLEISESPVPLRVQNLDFKLAPLSATLRWLNQLEYSFESGLKLEPVTLKDLSQQICIARELAPSGTLELTYPELRLASNHVYTKGEGLLNVFDGQIKIKEFEIDQLLSEAPTTYFSASWKNLELARIGEFTNFGGMQGHASGYIQDVNFVGTLLKEYDFEFRLKPRPNENKFYFSRKATQNLVEIFAQGQGLSQGPANFILRMSSRLFGDYGISYAGLRAHTQRNFVVLETFDPPSILKEQKSHFLLYGSRIKMPLSTQTYPVILSKNGWNGFVYYFRDSLLSLMNSPDEESNDQDATISAESSKPNPHLINFKVPCFDPSQEHRNSE